MKKAIVSAGLMMLSLVGYIASAIATKSTLGVLARASPDTQIYPNDSVIWAVSGGGSGPRPRLMHEPSGYGHARLLLLMSQVALVVAVALFYLWARGRAAGVTDQGRSIARWSFVPFGARRVGSGLIGLAEAIMRRPLMTVERLAVRCWFVAVLAVIALTAFADIPGYGDGSISDGTSVSAMRSALDNAGAAAIAGMLVALVSLALESWLFHASARGVDAQPAVADAHVV